MKSDNRSGRGEQSRRRSLADTRRPAVEREKSKSAEPTSDRRYADSGEHDGATGQQIVTNFNRSVWLEFNDPPKRSQKPWLLTAEQPPVKKPEQKAPEAKEEPKPADHVEEKKGKMGRNSVFSRLRRVKK